MNKIQEETSKIFAEFPSWAHSLAKSFTHLHDIDKIDDMVFSMRPDEVKKLAEDLPLENFSGFLKSLLGTPRYKSSPLALTSLLRIDGKPFTLAKRRFFEPLFYPSLPPRLLLVTGRQTGKSTSIAAQGVLQPACMPRFKVLFLAPQFEQIRRFSHQYIRQFVNQSFLKPLLIDKECIDSVLHKTFINGSELWFSFALLSVDRIRGLAVDAVRIDEIQDLQPDFLDIIRECTSASSNRSEMYAGTSKTVDNLMEQLRLQSSQAEWFMKCDHCNHWNIPTVAGSGEGLGVDRMLQEEGIACAKCLKPINPEDGCWVHKFPEKAEYFPGYHVPQVIVPVHYANAKNWKTLLLKRNTMAPAVFVNEVLGEACDEGQRLVSRSDLENAAVLHNNDFTTARNVAASGRHVDRILGVDWGGKGASQQSYTAVAVAGVTHSMDTIEILFGKVYPPLMDPVEETKEVVKMYSEFSCSGIAHDVAVAGEIRKSLIQTVGIPPNRLFNCRYIGGQVVKGMIEFKPASETSPSDYYNLDKSRVVAAVCAAIKAKKILLPNYRSTLNESGSSIYDHFLAVYEEVMESSHSMEKRLVKRNIGMPDDFLHAVCFAAVTLWNRYPSTVPDLSGVFFQDLSQKDLSRFEPHIRSHEDWLN